MTELVFLGTGNFLAPPGRRVADAPSTRQRSPTSLATSETPPHRTSAAGPIMISTNSGTPSPASSAGSGRPDPGFPTPSASHRCTATSWAWCRPTAPAVRGAAHQVQQGASGPDSARAPSSDPVHQPIQACSSSSGGSAVSDAPERTSALRARTFSAQYHCTSPM